jgi:hypothetical protein
LLLPLLPLLAVVLTLLSSFRISSPPPFIACRSCCVSHAATIDDASVMMTAFAAAKCIAGEMTKRLESLQHNEEVENIKKIPTRRSKPGDSQATDQQLDMLIGATQR